MRSDRLCSNSGAACATSGSSWVTRRRGGSNSRCTRYSRPRTPPRSRCSRTFPAPTRKLRWPFEPSSRSSAPYSYTCVKKTACCDGARTSRRLPPTPKAPPDHHPREWIIPSRNPPPSAAARPEASLPTDHRSPVGDFRSARAPPQPGVSLCRTC